MSQTEFKKIYDDMLALRKAGKHEETLKYVTDDATFMSPLHDALGHEALLEMKKTGKFDALDKAEYQHTIDEVKVFGVIAIDRGTVVAKFPSGEKKGNYLSVWVKVGSDWKIRNTCTTFRIDCIK